VNGRDRAEQNVSKNNIENNLSPKTSKKKSRSKSPSFFWMKKKVKKPGLTKADIGTPTNFQHINSVSDECRDVLKKAGVSDELLEDDATRDFILNFVQAHDVPIENEGETKVEDHVLLCDCDSFSIPI
jgi:hypothetical protein